jgi:hypothetical protein
MSGMSAILGCTHVFADFTIHELQLVDPRESSSLLHGLPIVGQWVNMPESHLYQPILTMHPNNGNFNACVSRYNLPGCHLRT